MGKSFTIELNGKMIRAGFGETLVDAGLGGRMVVPHDCCSGQCDTCRVEVVDGLVDDQGTARGNTVLACQATVAGDAVIRYEEVPIARKVGGHVSSISPLSREIVEVRIALDQPLGYLPGQYSSVKFRGYPARDYSPAPEFDGGQDESVLILHIKRLPGGIVSGDLGTRIVPGHPVRVRGPFGNAFLREKAQGNRLVLMSTGTGFAPIWAIARAACQSGRQSSIEMVIAVRDGLNFYMGQAIDWLHRQGVRRITIVNRHNPVPFSVHGRPTDHMPLLGVSDEVYVAGAPAFVDAVEDRAFIAGATCYADPFLPGRSVISLADRVTRLVMARQAPASATPVRGLAKWSDWKQANAER